MTTLHSSLFTRHSSLFTRHSSLFTRHSSLFTRHSSLITHHSSLVTHHSSLVTHHSSLFTLHSSLFTLHSSLFTLHSSLFTRHSSLITLHSSLVTSLSVYALTHHERRRLPRRAADAVHRAPEEAGAWGRCPDRRVEAGGLGEAEPAWHAGASRRSTPRHQLARPRPRRRPECRDERVAAGHRRSRRESRLALVGRLHGAAAG